jgi:hypothetical protein
LYNFDKIPNELREGRQWLVWRAEIVAETGKTTKIPIQALNGWMASVTDPAHWCSFQEAVNAYFVGAGKYAGIGRVFARTDPYCGIDLDQPQTQEDGERQQRIFELMPTYAERSPSGNGLHLICRAFVPQGRKRANIEIYSQERYFTFTGDVYRDAPIIDCNEIVNQLWSEMGHGATEQYYAGTDTEEYNDLQIIDRAGAAANGDLFNNLWRGDWQNENYPSQSEADQALMNILAFHTENRPQIMRLFRMSALGQRDKAKRDAYLNYTINKAFDLKLPPIDMSGLLEQARQVREHAAAKENEYEIVNAQLPLTGQPWQVPPTPFMKDIFDFFMKQAKYPVPEIALTGVMAMLSGMCGRAYNVSNTGLNQYFMLMADTGRGKESMQSGINALFSAVAHTEFPEIWQFMGPADIASGAALLKFLSLQDRPPCVLAITGEVGLRLQQISSPRAHAGDMTLRKVLLDLWAKSGQYDTAQPMIYSDSKNNTATIRAPSFTWLGESTSIEFLKGLDVGQISNGLVPRFLVTEYNGPRVTPNEYMNKFPDPALVLRMRELATILRDNMANNTVIDVGMTFDAHQKSRELELHIDSVINKNSEGPYVHLLNREWLKTMKLAALAAVTENFFKPIICPHHIDWAYAVVSRGTFLINSRFERGEVGEAPVEDAKQYADLCYWFTRYVHGKVKLDKSEVSLQQSSIVSYRLIQQSLSTIAAFRKDKQGATFALNRALADAIKTGLVDEVRPSQLGKAGGRFYAINAQFLPRELLGT